MSEYKMNIGQYTNEDNCEYIGYGITCLDSGHAVVSIRDVSNDRDQTLGLVSLCNQSQLSPDHLDDVVNDFIIKD